MARTEKKKKDTVLWKKKVIENCQPGGGLRSPPIPRSNRVGKKGRHLHSCPPLTSGSCLNPPAACIVSRVNHTRRMRRCPRHPLYCYSDPRVQTKLTSPGPSRAESTPRGAHTGPRLTVLLIFLQFHCLGLSGRESRENRGSGFLRSQDHAHVGLIRGSG